MSIWINDPTKREAIVNDITEVDFRKSSKPFVCRMSGLAITG